MKASLASTKGWKEGMGWTLLWFHSADWTGWHPIHMQIFAQDHEVVLGALDVGHLRQGNNLLLPGASRAT